MKTIIALSLLALLTFDTQADTNAVARALADPQLRAVLAELSKVQLSMTTNDAAIRSLNRERQLLIAADKPHVSQDAAFKKLSLINAQLGKRTVELELSRFQILKRHGVTEEEFYKVTKTKARVNRPMATRPSQVR